MVVSDFVVVEVVKNSLLSYQFAMLKRTWSLLRHCLRLSKPVQPVDRSIRHQAVTKMFSLLVEDICLIESIEYQRSTPIYLHPSDFIEPNLA